MKVDIMLYDTAQNGEIKRFARGYKEGVLNTFIQSSLHQVRELSAGRSLP